MSNIRLIDFGDEWRVGSPPAKTAPTFTLAQLEQWSKEFAEDIDADVTDRLLLSSWLAWLTHNKTEENSSGPSIR